MAAVVTDGESAGERAYRSVREGLLTGRYVGGAMLSEATLAAELGLSRTPVRAALIRLQDEGWVTIYPKRGALVQTLSERAIAELAEVKVMLESGAVRGMDAAGRDALAERLRPDLDEQRRALAAGDLSAFVELSIRFHRSFVACSGNSVLLELYDRLADRQRFLLFSYGARLLERADEIVDEHRAMINAVVADDPAAFLQVLRGHLTDTYGGDTLTRFAE